ncbi:MAG: 16S rRNA (cytosine(1402)-N(4))-methyltransferase RsmH [Planctomycetota bacterium]|nr:16S rRNA (cytosine(1402)-N(4))-methyltransferase RsmH [Planctomycetota bacterium]
MPDPTSDRPPRRPRYRGKNPRAFHEKYKELAPQQYPEDVAKVIASGKTPAGTHRPVMRDEILAGLAPQAGNIAVDCTLGYGGHASELLTAIQPGGRLIAFDVDPIELERTEARLRGLNFPTESLVVRRMNFAGVAQVLATEAPGGADLLLADLGVSSMQLDDPTRGFTFKFDGPLDMRMNPTRGRSAADLLQSIDADELAELLVEHSEEPHARAIAESIVTGQRNQPVDSTLRLRAIVAGVIERKRSNDPDAVNDAVRRVFQALRIAVNDEFGALDALLRNLPWCLKPGGRVAILTFHSGEDRRVKQAFRSGLHEGTYSNVSDEVLRPSAEERRSNPRCVSAKLRFATRAG